MAAVLLFLLLVPLPPPDDPPRFTAGPLGGLPVFRPDDVTVAGTEEPHKKIKIFR